MAAEGRRVEAVGIRKAGPYHNRPEPALPGYHLGCDRKPRVSGQGAVWRRNLVKPPWVDALADACLTIGAIVLAGFALGCIAYAGMMFL